MGAPWQGTLTLSLVVLVTAEATGENGAGQTWHAHHNHQTGHLALHHAQHASSMPQHQSSPCDNGTGHPADKAHLLGPVFQEQPVDTEFFQQLPERTVTLHCCARANPPASYRWMLNESYIEFSKGFELRDGNLVISPAEQSLHAGVYQCEASNDAGSVLSNKATLHFIYLDSFSMASRDMKPGLRENHGAYVLCDPPPHSPGVRFDWLYEDGANSSAGPRRISQDSRRFVSQKTGDLFFARVDLSDVGHYACLMHMGPPLNKTVKSPFIELQLRKGLEGGSFPVHLKVRPPPVMTVLVGQKLRMECFGLGNPVPSVAWRRLDGHGGGEPLPAGPVLEIEDVQTFHQATYECAASNALGNASAQTRVSVHAPPQWTREIPNKNVNIGDDLSWRCNATGMPAPSYQWLQNGNLLSSQGRVRVSRDGRLSISRVNVSDEGMYQCVAQNDHGEIYSSAQLRVLAFPPQFEPGHPTVVQAVAGGSVEIPCAPRSAPRPAVSWSRGTELLTNSSRMTIVGNGSLIIRALEKPDARNYTCFASNSLGKANVTMTLQVKEPTIITRPPKGASVKVGDEVTLQCNAHADSSLDVAFVWMLHDRPIDTEAENAHYRRVHGMGDLKIVNIQLRHEGAYTCQAQTVVDTASAAADVVVRGPPGPPGGVKAMPLNSTAVRVTWSHGADHHCLITMYSLQYCAVLLAPACELWVHARTDPRAIEGNQESAVVVKLKPWLEYEFRVVAHNPCGSSEHSKASPRVRTPGAVPTIVPSGVGGGGGIHRELIVTWTPVPQEYRFGDNFQFNVLFRALNDTEWTTVVVAGADASRLVYQNVSQEPYTPFKVKIQARNDHGVGPYSPDVVVYSAEDEPDAAPRWAAAFPVSHSKIDVTWEAILPNATARRVTGYEIRYWRAEDNQAAAERYWTETITNRTIIPGLEPEKEYHVEVRGYNMGGTGPPSPIANVTTFRHEPEVKVVKMKDRVVTFEWQAIHSRDNESAVTKYQVTYRLKNAIDSKGFKVNTSQTKVKVPLFEKGEYLVTVQAFNAAGRVGSTGKLNFNHTAAGGGVSREHATWTLLLCGFVQLLCSWGEGL